jgi:ribosomal protein L11 methyltransferase
MPWLQCSLDAGDQDADALGAFFDARGALSVTFADAADQPLFEPDPGTTPLWSATRVTALFDARHDIGALRAAVAAAFGVAAAERLSCQPLEDRDWERAWLDAFQPMRFGQRLWVCPAGQRPPPQDDAVFIDLDPGLAFGTGTHATTALCLAWLDRHEPRGLDVLDYGCGSGILAIAALKLGAASVWAVDVDPQALWASRENAQRNEVAGRLHTGLPEQLPEQRFDLLLANILANPLVQLAPDFAQRVRSGGELVLSGILEAQADAVLDSYRPWFDVAAPEGQDGWVRLAARRR